MNRYITFDIIQLSDIKSIKSVSNIVLFEYQSSYLNRRTTVPLDNEVSRFQLILNRFKIDYKEKRYKDFDENIYAWENLVDSLGMPEAELISDDYNDLTEAIKLTEITVRSLLDLQKQIRLAFLYDQKVIHLKLENGKNKALKIYFGTLKPNNDEIHQPNKKYTNEMHLAFDTFLKDLNPDKAYDELINKYPNVIKPNKFESFKKMHRNWVSKYHRSKLPKLKK